MPRPIDKERRGLWRLLVVGVCSVMGLILFAQLLLLLNPPNQIDKRCLRKPLAELQRCVWDVQHGR